MLVLDLEVNTHLVFNPSCSAEGNLARTVPVRIGGRILDCTPRTVESILTICGMLIAGTVVALIENPHRHHHGT